MDGPLRILHLEDDPGASARVQETLAAGGFSCEVMRVSTQAGFRTSLGQDDFDLILADNTLPSFDSLSALRLATERRPEVPFIFVSGTLNEEVAIESLKLGATDYILKSKMSQLVPSVRRALREAEDRARRAQAERALRRSESYLVEAQRLSHTGSFGWNPASGAIYWSEETYRIFGVEPGTSPTLELVVQRTHPDDRAAVQATIERALRDGLDFEHKYRLLMPGGSVKHLHVVAHSMTDDGGRREFVGAVMDVTEREHAQKGLRASETRFRTFVDHASDAFIVHDEAGYIVDANRQACENLGYTREQLIGMHPRAFDPGIAADEARIGQMYRRLAAGETFAFETIQRRKDGTLFPAEVRLRPFLHDGRVFGLALSRDITEHKRAEEERERTRQLEQEQQSAVAAERTRLAGEIHDTLAQGLAMIVMQLADAEAKLGPAWARAEKPLGLVRELAVESLAYARRSVMMLQPSAPAAGLARAIRDLVDSGRRHFGGRLNFAVTGTAVLLPASVESALAGVAREALTNATRHSGAPRVEVELAFQDGGAVRLAVADDGAGFDVANVRADSYGLTSMQDRAARAGVALTFVTEPGAGTEVVASWSP